MSANRKAGRPVCRKPTLRLVPSPVEERKPPATDPKLKEILDDMRRRHRVQQERIEQGPDGQDAA